MTVFKKPDSGVGRIPRHCGVRSARRPLGVRKACARTFSPTVKKKSPPMWNRQPFHGVSGILDANL